MVAWRLWSFQLNVWMIVTMNWIDCVENIRVMLHAHRPSCLFTFILCRWLITFEVKSKKKVYWVNGINKAAVTTFFSTIQTHFQAFWFLKIGYYRHRFLGRCVVDIARWSWSRINNKNTIHLKCISLSLITIHTIYRCDLKESNKK